MKKNDTEFARFKRSMARMQAEKRKAEASLKAIKVKEKEIKK